MENRNIFFNIEKMKSSNVPPDYYLDISDDVCPMTFVKARLSIEKMSVGQVLDIRLRGEEPLKNVPESLIELGHRIISLAPESGEAAGDGHYRLIVEKA